MSTSQPARNSGAVPGAASLRTLLWVGHGVNDTHVFLLPLVLPLILRELSLPFSTAGLLVSGFLFVMALSSYLFGRSSDRSSPWGILGVGFTVAAACLVAAGLVSIPVLLVVFLLVAAVGVGTFHPVAYAQIDRLSLGGSGSAYGMFELWGGVALIVMYVANGSLLGWIGWKGVLVVTGVPGFALGALFLRRLAVGGGAGPESRAAAAAGAVPKASGGDDPAPAPIESTVGGAAGRQGSPAAFALVMGAALLRYLSSMAVTTFAPTFLAIGRGLATNWAVYLSGLIFLGSLIASPLLGRLADRRDPLWILIVVTGAIAPLMILFSLPLPLWALPLVIVALGAAIGGCAPPQNLVLTLYGAGLGRGQIFGIMMGVLSLMASVGPFVYGRLSDLFGLERALRVLAAPTVVGWVLVLILGVVRRRGRGASPCGAGTAGPSSPTG